MILEYGIIVFRNQDLDFPCVTRAVDVAALREHSTQLRLHGGTGSRIAAHHGAARTIERPGLTFGVGTMI
jgi:hypothetical protein